MKNIIKQKNQKGITLIALVITIIVLLILAGVSIATLVGEDGIVNKSKEAKLSTEIANEKDQIVAAYSAAKIAKEGETVEATDLNNALIGDNVKANATTSTNPGEIKVEFTESQREYIITNDGKIQTGNIEGENTPTPESSKVKPGEYVTKTEKDNYYDGKEYATIPKGFTVSGIKEEQKISDGLVIYDIPQDSTIDWTADKNGNQMLDVQEDYNQFVWVPVNNFSDFKRRPGWNGNLMDNIELVDKEYGEVIEDKLVEDVSDGIKNVTEVDKAYKCVKDYSGFYFGRYELGKLENDQLVVRKNVSPIGAYRVTEKNIYKDKNLYDAITMECYSAQWDTTLEFIDPDYSKIDHQGFARNSTKQGWYIDNYNNGNQGNSINPNFLTGIDLIYNNDNIIRNRQKNIYDMAGNCAEHMQEYIQKSYYNGNTTDWIWRGGSSESRGGGEYSPASNRTTVWDTGNQSYGTRIAMAIEE